MLGALAFFTGRAVEKQALARTQRSFVRLTVPSTPTTKPEMPTYRELTAADIIALPFAEFYEALRSAPGEAREKWRIDLERMPAGPRRNAAVAGFYKLLVEFDPVTAVKDACEIEDKDLRNLALQSVAGAAPGFALRDIATLLLDNPADAPDYLNLYEIMGQWITIDPAAVAKFCDEHPDAAERGNTSELVKAWAAIDPQAAQEWLTANRYGIGISGDFVMGWYLNDRAAAIDFAVAHADELVPSAGLGTLFSALYLDSKEEAKKFIERLPNDELRHNAFRGCEIAVQFGTAEETGEPERTPRAVADWAVQFPPAYWRGHLQEVLHYWNHVPPQEVFSWIEQRPSTIRNEVAAEFKLGVGDQVVDVVSALLQYGNTDLRNQLFMALFQNSASDISHMKEAIVGSSLSGAQKHEVLEFAAKAEVAAEEQAAREKAADEGQRREN